MKRLLLIASLVVFFIASFSNINAQTIIGNQSSTTQSNSYPINGYYEYGWSNSIYLQSEIATPSGGSLSSIAFYVNNSSSNCTLNNQKIYVRHTSETAYNNSTYVGTAGFTLVYDGSISFIGMGWKTINFTTPFNYNGTSNLEFLFENKNGTYSNYFPNFKTTVTYSNTGATVYRTKRDYKITEFPSSCYSCAQIGYRPNIQLTIQPCAYTAGTVSTTTPSVFIGNSATLNLSDQSSGASVQWQSSSDNLSFKNISGATNPSYLAANLMETTYYRALVTFSSGCKYISNSAMVTVDISNLTTSSIGNGVATFDKYPFNGYYDYSWASMLYKASEINSTGKLSRISFYVDNNPVNATMKNQKIYVRHTTTSEYSELAYPSTTGFTLVYDGSITYNGTGWKEIVLQNVFEYNGVDDLEFLFENRDGSWDNNYPIFRGQSEMPEYRVKRDFNDLNFSEACVNCGKHQNILNIKMKFIPCTINGGTLSSTSISSRVGENVQLTLSEQSSTGTIQWEQSSNNITFTLIPNQSGTSLTIPMTILPLYVRTVTKDVCYKYSNVVMVIPDDCFMANSSIGTGHSETEKYPFNVYYNNSWSNVIYTQKEIGSAGKIASLSFNVLNSPVNYITKNQTIYVRTKIDTVFTDSTYTGTTGFTKIFEGDITYNGAGWKEIPLTTPFDYDGESNLEFLFENRDQSWGGSYPTFEYSSGTSGYRVKRDYYDDAFPLTCTSCRKFQNIPNVKVKFLAPPNATGTLSATETEICSGETTTLNIEGQITGSTLQWQSSTDNVSFVNVDGATASTYTTSEITATTYYRAVVSVGACSVNSVVITVALNCPAKIIFNDETGVGSVEVNISSIVDKVGPYHYIISEYPIPDLKESYYYLRDTIYGDTIPVDSIAFFTGKNPETLFAFNELYISEYYLAVFDSRGIRVFDKRVIVSPELILSENIALSITKENITSSSSNSRGVINAYLDESSTGEITYRLTNNTVEQFIGLINDASTLLNKTSLAYGYSILNGNIKTIENGVESNLSYAVSNNSELSLIQDEGTLVYLVDGLVLKTVSLPASYLLKGGIGINQNGTSVKVLMKRPAPHPAIDGPHKLKFITNYTHFNCQGQLGKINFSVFDSKGDVNVLTLVYTITNEAGVIVQSQTGVNAGFSYICQAPNLLVPGDYTLAGYGLGISHGYPITPITITIGYETTWQQVTGYNLTPNVYSLKSSTSSSFTYAKALSENTILSTDIGGWVEIIPQAYNIFGWPTPYNKISFTSSIGTPVAPTSGEPFLIFRKVLNFPNLIRISTNTSGSINYPANSKIRFKFVSATTIHVFINNQHVPLFNMVRPAGDLRYKVNSNKLNDGVRNAISSYKCSPADDIYAELKYDLDGYYHIMKEGKIKFMFNQEYDASALKFNIYNEMDVLIKTEADFPVWNTTNGANYVTLDVSDNQHCIGNKYFYLEVINEKKERFYLRFYNHYTGCQ